ncbi:glycosyltransferase family 2 protein [Halomonas sp. CUBES01]|uniref:Glycosyltransferase family 2 protein n=1 Tax=Vreelandella gomseomensis TaxID=370766 RepID=A0ABU1GA97_9GAMM|nr:MULTISPECIES: glycosyltransferase family 2 protein [Halomonas]MDR5874408.1 glycosyltransferase family 2 protein [Halomonas gomseomensis]MEC4765798.1 glycosyltransferase family 2 protein [Halomonas sp. CUBES01]
MMPIGMSVVIITRNAASTLVSTLDALSEFGEVVIYDNGSIDETPSIAARYPNVSLHQGEFFGFGLTKRHAVSLAKNDWILSLDADEVPSKRLTTELRQWIASARSCDIGNVLRENSMLGRPVRHSGWGNDWLVRLFNRRDYNFNDAMVHESVEIDHKANIIQLPGCIEHAAVTDLSQFLEKINRYSTLRSNSGKLKKYSPGVIFLKSIFAFIRTYFFQLGVLDGWRGLVIAVANANGVFWKYIKFYNVK